jgi:hypothetical protein
MRNESSVGSACAQASGANVAATTQNLIGLDTHDKCPVAAKYGGALLRVKRACFAEVSELAS